MEDRKDLVVVTGASGMIGSALIDRLVDRYAVVGLDIKEPADGWPTGTEFVCCDLSSDASAAEAIDHVREQHGTRIASVVHLAAYYDFSGAPSGKYETITVQGTRRLLEGVKGLEVGQFIFSSTMLVHAPTRPGKPIDEDWPLEPKWDYPKSKVRTEKLLREQHGDIPLLLMRIAGVYDDYGHSPPLTNQIQRIYEKQITGRVYPGHLDYGQAFVHLEDLVDALVAAIDRREQLPNELALLIGEPETMSYEEIQREISQQLFGSARQTYRIPKTLAKPGAWLQDHMPGSHTFIKPWMIDLADDHYELDIRRAHAHLGWLPKHRLRDSVPTMIRNLRANPLRWYEEHGLEVPSRLKRPTRRAG